MSITSSLLTLAPLRTMLTALFTFTVAAIAWHIVRSWIKNRRYRLPVQIPGVPIFGNSFQVPAVQQGPWAKALAEKYGEM
jgi:hypothetical protein